MTKLYSVMTKVPEFRGCKDVTFSWFFAGERKPGERDYAALISGYDPSDELAFYARLAVDELFTEQEATALKAFLDEHREGGETIILEEKRPLGRNIAGVSSIAVGGGDDFLQFRNCPLPFKVEGYFNLRHCELADGSGIYGGYNFLVGAGTMHKQHYIEGPDGTLHESNREDI
jgi:hypothetical protein